MNERIRELAVQVNTIGDWGEDITEGRYFVYPDIKNLEKFAELIIQECLEACRVACEIKHPTPPSQQQVVWSCMREIEETFRS